MEGDTTAASGGVGDGGVPIDPPVADAASDAAGGDGGAAAAALTKMQVPQPPGSASAAAAAAASIAAVAGDENDVDDGPYPYRATVALLVALHLVFVHQWNTRRRKDDVQYSYRSLVVERKYHGAVLAFFSHAGGGGAEEGGQSSGALSSLRDVVRSLTRGSLSGLPLLGYSSHLLWKLKPLEPYFGGAIPYCRVAVALLSVAVAVELMLQRMVLNCLSSHHRAFGGGSRTNRDAAWHVMARGTSGVSVLVGALLMLDAEYRFGHHRRGGEAAEFPPPQPAAMMPGQITLAIRLILLTALSWRYHKSGPLVGALSGALFASNVTSFLAEPYWSNALLIAAGLACAASLKASGGRGADYVPCVDFVAWDASGRYRRGTEAGGGGGGSSSRRRGGGAAGVRPGAADSDDEGESSVATDDDEDVALLRGGAGPSGGAGGGGGDIESAGTPATPRSRGVRANGTGTAETFSPSVDSRAGGGGVLRSGSSGVGGAFSRQGGSSRRRPDREDTS